MPLTQKNINRVRITAQERLDLPDFNALQGLVDDAMQLQLGALLGRGGGVFAPFTVATSTDGVNRWLELTPFQYYWSARDTDLAATSAAAYRGWRGGVSQYNPNAPGQVTKIPYTDALALGVATYLYARPLEVATDTDARRKFAAGVEQTTSMQTRLTITTQFKLSSLLPDHDSNNGWAPVLYIGGWAANLPTGVYNISVWDSWSAYAVGGGTGGYMSDDGSCLAKPLTCLAFDTTDANLPAFDGSKTQDDDMGLIQLLALYRSRLRRHLDPAGGDPWFGDPAMGLNDLYTSLVVAQEDIQVLQLQAQAGALVHACGFVGFDSGVGAFTLPTTPDVIYGTPRNCALRGFTLPGEVTVDILNVPTGYHLAAVHATPYSGASLMSISGRITQNTGVPGVDNTVAFTVRNIAGKVNEVFYFTVYITKDV